MAKCPPRMNRSRLRRRSEKSSPGWINAFAKDEQHAIECRQKAYAEAAEARRADDAVNAYKRDLELRRRQREQQQKKEAEEEKAKKEADARAAAARKRALPKKRRLRRNYHRSRRAKQRPCRSRSLLNKKRKLWT